MNQSSWSGSSKAEVLYKKKKPAMPLNSQTLSYFLAAFYPAEQETIHLRAFAPKKAPKDEARFGARKLTATRHALATDTALQEQLCQLNEARGLYFVVNAGGDTDEEITRFNAWFAEDDTRPIDEQHRRLDAAPLEPSIRVETSKSIHAYWLIKDGCEAEEWRDIQQRLIFHFGGDEKIKNPSRVMRLPFFNHIQYDKETGALSFKQVKLIKFAPERRYTVAEMQSAFAPVPKPMPEPPVGEAQLSESGFPTWDAINAEVVQRIKLSPKARTDRKGWTQAPGICHGSIEGKAQYVSPDGAYGCHKGCSAAQVRASHGLPERLDTLEPESSAKGETSDKGAPLRLVCMADVQPESVSWLWHPYIALGKLTFLEGDPGLGKSWITCAIAASITTGRGLPNAEPFEPRNVLMLSAEDGLADTLRPRLDAVGADVSRVFALDEPLTFDQIGLLRLEAAIIENKADFVTIDPFFAYTGGKVDIHRANECRAISAPLAAIAERQGCALLAVRHLGKSRGSGHALNAGIGSIDFVAAARSVLLAGIDPDEPSRRAIVQTKNNLAPHGEAIGYMLEGGQFYWTGASDLTAGRILSAVSDEEERGTIAEAMDFLRTALSDGARDSKAVKDEAKQAGVSEATLRRAKDRLKVRVKKVGLPGSHFQKWVWELSTEGAQLPSEDAQVNKVEHLRASETTKDSYHNNLPEDAQPLILEHLRADEIHIPANMSDEEYEQQYRERQTAAR
jgi:AAA domain-containing protein/DNA primase RepB-like protein